MKKLKGIKSLVFLLTLCISSISFAQPPGGQGGGPKLPSDKEISKMVVELGKELTLSESQEELVLAVYKTHFEEVEEKMSDSSRPDRDEMEALEVSFQTEVKELLTDEQIVKYDAYLKEEQQNRKQRPER